ncbi:DUF2726 domain-containing protein [Acuticoccus sp. MNP-M23]|uniref:DUF2726 domain-containing protein n=1 Tax=Acuticoccus sp. MNP-M23 TaxID=3072793 RepID=UPI00281658EE|nr:DUF2726 domain-containing protein [Acuticoccus sp. MNP-M23]WMS44002.1 DUF2726 domain-containing protein [Acuticoccus sp. MNP-M23]
MDVMTLHLAVTFAICLGVVLVGSRVRALVRRLRAPKFYATTLLNKSETKLFARLTKATRPGWQICPQVSYGEFVRCENFRRFASVNAKRADFVVCDAGFNVIGVIEYQGSGHWGSTRRSRRDAKGRDKVKRRALSEARIPLLELYDGYTATEIERWMHMLDRKAAGN